MTAGERTEVGSRNDAVDEWEYGVIVSAAVLNSGRAKLLPTCNVKCLYYSKNKQPNRGCLLK